MQTPAGLIVTHIRRTRQMQKDGISLPFVESYAIESPDDSGAIGSVFEHLEVVPTPESYRLFQRRVGDDGIAVARGPVAASPIHLMRHELALMDQFFYRYSGVHDQMHGLAERMLPFFDTALDALTQCGAEVVVRGAIYDQNLTAVLQK